MKKSKIADLVIFILSAELIGAASASFSGSFSDFFEKYKEPPLLPPEWLFPIVWTILYAVMGISAFLIWNSGDEPEKIKKALRVYWVQLAVNFSWSIIYFRFEMLWPAFAVILLMWVLILLMIIMFRKIKPTAAYINIPYLLWVTFAAYLNLATAIINS